ncbi:AzlD domain-containing protein [Acrocarpospora catenulata]|uniref:AzlD domain-containing protein n=1 Tax=Acrocarpospora catenulata TaxID=2836182 RepID=UPI001BDB4A36|nr:AzlD domain-containing protein [Acrocarpospora catenulata]
MTAPWLVILAVGLGSYAFRISFVMLADQVILPDRLERATGFVAPAAFTALATTSVIATCAQSPLTSAIPPLLAVTAAVAAVTRTGSPRTALLAGMPVLWLASYLLTV